MIGIVNYGGGNLFSLKAALDRAGLPHGMIHVPEDFASFSHIVIPGVGHAGKCMEKLEENNLRQTILDSKKPVLGICVGMQLLSQFSEEGNSPLLGVLPQKTIHFNNCDGLKIPHMGWNQVNFKGHDLFKNIEPGSHFYFVHSFFVEVHKKTTIATAQHGNRFSAAVQFENYYGVQFHPEKSGTAGKQLLLNFSQL